jgi:hypothetical protein
MENHIKYSKAVSWFSDCRIPFVDEGENNLVFNRSGRGGFREKLVGCEIKEEYRWKQNNGRFPANLLVSDDMLNDGVISKSNNNIRNNRIEQKIYGGGKGIPPQSTNGFNDKGTNSRYYDIDKWFDKIIE